MRRFAFENGLSLFFAVIFLASVGGQSLAGQRAFNAEQRAHGEETYSWIRYVFSSDFGGAVMENWQSEFLQFTLFILATVWLVQKGSNESKKLEDVGVESKQQQKLEGYAPQNAPAWAKVAGWRSVVYQNSLLIVMTAIFLMTWLAQSLNNWTQFNEEQREHDETTISWGDYLTNADFWERTLQNWQSEFLAVGTMAVFTIYLRQRGSPESKPVGAPHADTASSGLALLRLEIAEVHDVADRAFAVQAARVRKRRVHHDDVAGVDFDRLRVSSVQRPHDQATVGRVSCCQRDAEDRAVGPSVRPLGLLVDVRRQRVVDRGVGRVQDDLRIAQLAHPQFGRERLEQPEDLRVPLQVRKPVRRPEPPAERVRRQPVQHQVEVHVAQRALNGCLRNSTVQDVVPRRRQRGRGFHRRLAHRSVGHRLDNM